MKTGLCVCMKGSFGCSHATHSLHSPCWEELCAVWAFGLGQMLIYSCPTLCLCQKRLTKQWYCGWCFLLFGPLLCLSFAVKVSIRHPDLNPEPAGSMSVFRCFCLLPCFPSGLPRVSTLTVTIRTYIHASSHQHNVRNPAAAAAASSSGATQWGENGSHEAANCKEA